MERISHLCDEGSKLSNLFFGPDFNADSLSPSEVVSLQCSPFSSQEIILYACFFDSCMEQIKALELVFLNEPKAKDSDPTELTPSVLVPVKEFLCTLKTSTALTTVLVCK